MPDTRSNRGAHPKDRAAFAPEHVPGLRKACGDLSWLLGRGYPGKAALALVGNRYALSARQRTALQRTAAGADAVEARRAREVPLTALAGSEVALDGYNVLLTVETALGGGVILAARDGAFRDMASMSGHYRRVRQTGPALEAVGEVLEEAGSTHARWLLDRPISNSGRLKAWMEETAAARGWSWTVELVANPDRDLVTRPEILPHPIATADSAVLDRCRRWVNLARRVVESRAPEAWVVDLSVEDEGAETS